MSTTTVGKKRGKKMLNIESETVPAPAGAGGGVNATGNTFYFTKESKKNQQLNAETTAASTPNLSNCKEYVPNEDHLLEMRTISGNTFKNLLDTLKAVLNEANIVFTEQGLKLAAIDTKRHALVHLSMDASSFEFYHCKQKLILGFDIELLHKTVKTNKLNDLMCFTVHKDDTHCLEISFENFQKGTRICDKIKLLSLPEYVITDKIAYKPPPEIDSQSFQTICREMSSFHATKIEIQCTGDELIFTNLDGITQRRVVIKITPNDANEKYDEKDNARGVFLLKFLKSFAKAANLSPRVRIYLQNNNPLICEYSVAGLGTLKYVLTSLEE